MKNLTAFCKSSLNSCRSSIVIAPSRISWRRFTIVFDRVISIITPVCFRSFLILSHNSQKRSAPGLSLCQQFCILLAQMFHVSLLPFWYFFPRQFPVPFWYFHHCLLCHISMLSQICMTSASVYLILPFRQNYSTIPYRKKVYKNVLYNDSCR